jgi:hypothetical protein
VGRIVYLSWPAHEIAGGIKAVFQHVEMLREGGFDAVVATEDGKTAPWFESSAPVVTLDRIAADDALVLPENSKPLLERFAAGPQRKLVFCQNPYYVFRGLGGAACYSEFGVSHVLCPSHTVEAFCQVRLPRLARAYTPYFIDHTVFRCPPRKSLAIACVPRKRPLEAAVVQDLFRAAHPEFREVPWLVLEKRSQAEVAAAMGRAAVYLSLQRFEAHGMTTLEAMASGCISAGFAGVFGGNDSTRPDNGFWAEEDDVLGCATQLGRAVALAAQAGPDYRRMLQATLDTAREYRREEAARHLLAFWRAFLG